MSRILIAGAGDVGLALAARFVADGHTVATLNRSGRSVGGATVVRADLGDPASLSDLPATDTVVLTTAPPSRDEAGYCLTYIDGPRNLLDALPIRPARVVLTSTTGVYGVDDGSWVDEDSPAAPTRATAEIVVEGEAALRDRPDTTVVLRSAGIYGPGRDRLVRQVRDGAAGVTPGTPPRWTNRIHRDDLAAALAHVSLHDDPPPIAIAVDDDPVPRDDVLDFIAERLGVELGPDPDPADRERGKRCRNTVLRATGWEPGYPSYREGYAMLLGDG